MGYSLSGSLLNFVNRVVTGMLRGFDQFMNLVMDNTVEVNGNDKNDIGMVVSYLLCFILLLLRHQTSSIKMFPAKLSLE